MPGISRPNSQYIRERERERGRQRERERERVREFSKCGQWYAHASFAFLPVGDIHSFSEPQLTSASNCLSRHLSSTALSPHQTGRELPPVRSSVGGPPSQIRPFQPRQEISAKKWEIQPTVARPLLHAAGWLYFAVWELTALEAVSEATVWGRSGSWRWRKFSEGIANTGRVRSSRAGLGTNFPVRGSC